MAKTKLAAPLAGIRGTVGGLVYSANQSGTYVKAWNPPTNPKTPSQMLERSYLAQMPTLWNALTPVQRAAWNTFAALGAQAQTDSLGQTYYISGWLWFVKCNIRLLRVGRTPGTAAPVIARPAAPTIDVMRVTLAGTDTDLCTGGSASASSTNGAQVAALAFDNNLATYWESAIGTPYAWIGYTCPATQIVQRFDLYIANITNGPNPKSFTIRYWDGAAWQNVASFSNFIPTATGWHSFFFPSTVSSTYWSLLVTANYNPATTSTQVYELAFFDGLIDGSVICYPEDEFTTVAYDLILKISMVDSQSKFVQHPGYYEVLAESSPGRWYETFQDELATTFGTVLEGRQWFARLYRQTTEGLRSAAATTAANTQA